MDAFVLLRRDLVDFLEIRSTLGRLFCNYLSETFHCDEAAAVKENIDILAWKNIQRMLDECDYRGVAFVAEGFWFYMI